MLHCVMNTSTPPIKPLLRGWSHGVAAVVSVAGLVALILVTRHDPAKLVSMVVYGTGLVLLFGVSATYHIFNWPPRVKDWLRRADHATGWLAVVALVPLTAALGWAAAALMALGGLQYSLGAAAYAFKRPRLWPRVFGYHELFHVAVITASVT